MRFSYHEQIVRALLKLNLDLGFGISKTNRLVRKHLRRHRRSLAAFCRGIERLNAIIERAGTCPG